MVTVRWEPLAIKQLKAIYKYYYNVAGEKKALKVRDEIKKTADNLAYHPFLGKIEEMDEIEEKFRSLVVSRNFKIIYLVEESVLVIFTIWDVRQDPEKLRAMLR